MKWFYNLKAATQLFIAILLVTVIAGVSGYLFSHTANAIFIFAGIILAVIVGYYLSHSISATINSVTEPLEYVSKFIEKMANGEDFEGINATYKGNYTALMDNLNLVRKSLCTLHDETSMLSKAAAEGQVSARCNVNKLRGGYGDIIKSINATLDVVMAPFNEAKQVLSKMAVNDYSLEMTGQYKGMLKEFADSIVNVRLRLLSVQDIFVRISNGDFSRLEEFKKIGRRSDNDQLIPACTVMMQTILSIIAEANFLTEAAISGNLDARGDIGKFTGEYIKIIDGFNRTLDAIVVPLNDAIKVMGGFAVNDITMSMTGQYRGRFKDFADEINEVRKRLLIIQDIFIRIAKGDTSRLDEMKKIGRRSENDALLPAMIEMMEAVKGLIDEVGVLAKSAQDGDLGKRADSGKFEGGYKQVIEGFNRTIDAVVEPINGAVKVLGNMAVNDYALEMTGQYNGMLKDFAEKINLVRTRLLSVQDIAVRVSKGDISRLDEFIKIGRRSENDKLIPSFGNMMQAIQDLINETSTLANASINGNLASRGNIDKFEGGYKEIISGMNKTMDAVAKPIQEASSVMQEMAKGNLTITMDGEYKGDYAKLKDALNFTITSFNEVLNDINNAAQQVASGAGQVADSAQALSQSSTEQAGSIQELTSSLEEISTQTKQNALNADQANEMAVTAKEDAVNGNEHMKELLKAMKDINEASGDISKIIKVIDEIAFQTNLLALNAAVEAARAGQHGKGFAVVAEEVRNLAARSANAAKETTALIEGSIKKAEGGTNIASGTAAALNKIVDAVSKVTNLVGKITIASNEQASGIAQTNQGIMQVSQAVQTNSATSQESAAASEELSGQAEILKSLVSKFKLKDDGSARYKSIEGVNPEVLRMLENINGMKVNNNDIKKKRFEVSKPQISLNDKDFGKY